MKSRFVIVVALVGFMAFFNEVAVLKSITKVNENIANEQEHSLGSNVIIDEKTVRNVEQDETNDVPKARKIVGFSTSDFVNVASRWYEELSRLGYDEHVVIALDDAAFAHFNEKGYRVERHVLGKEGSLRSLWAERFAYVQNQIEKGVSILLTDVDNIFSRYISLDHFDFDTETDVFHAHETKFPESAYKKQGFVFCGGLIYFKANERVKRFMDILISLCKNTGNNGKLMCNDQVVLNSAYADYNQLKMKWNMTIETNSTRTSHRFDVMDGLLIKEFTGKSETTGHTVRVWDRNFAYRGVIEDEDAKHLQTCPVENW
eukprot:CAMPEP_0116071898 /NCGR_PEP_ID=MMETSP0322-20121206/14113_1 /TAXON_ID=163516 /ORGANISM="Leptocylindrus danicus var. apora, Strain B651" /LENGTH=316 /DNA_ID=CAMNT_0003560453 /DNA_START=228 /DNA_END=1175 /DNA_ORIENTATION=+